jgi:hypothetical protein
MPTGQRGASRPNPGDTTGMTFFRQQRDQDAKRKLADQGHDDDEARKQVFSAGFDAGHDAGWSAAVKWITENFDVFDKADETDEAE